MNFCDIESDLKYFKTKVAFNLMIKIFLRGIYDRLINIF